VSDKHESTKVRVSMLYFQYSRVVASTTRQGCQVCQVAEYFPQCYATNV
jgi:hypothetical protein